MKFTEAKLELVITDLSKAQEHSLHLIIHHKTRP